MLKPFISDPMAAIKMKLLQTVLTLQGSQRSISYLQHKACHLMTAACPLLTGSLKWRYDPTIVAWNPISEVFHVG